MSILASDMREAALLAYRRGDDDAGALLRAALASDPLDGGLLIAEATAALEAGQDDALGRLSQVLEQAPEWRAGHVALARLQWERGDRARFAASIEGALRRLPRQAGLWMCYMDLLAEAGLSLAAADTAAQLRRQGDVPALRLIEARHAGAGGDLDRAESLLADLPADLPGAAIARARQRLRRGDPAAAERLLAAERQAASADTVVWALSELAWRALGDPRHHDLIATDTDIAALEIEASDEDWTTLAEVLRAVHRRRWMPMGQSIRGGSQTRGSLTDRPEPVLAAVLAQVEAAGRTLSQRLRARGQSPVPPPSARIGIVASWSVRLSAGGHHVAHIHPGGTFSSALHIVVPDAPPGEGALELGRPPAEFEALGLGPLCLFPAAARRLFLFPSWLYHGTRPFGAGERMTMAFDLA